MNAQGNQSFATMSIIVLAMTANHSQIHGLDRTCTDINAVDAVLACMLHEGNEDQGKCGYTLSTVMGAKIAAPA